MSMTLPHQDMADVVLRTQRKPISELLIVSGDNYADPNASIRVFQERRRSMVMDSPGTFANIVAKLEQTSSPSVDSSRTPSLSSVRRRTSIALSNANGLLDNMRRLSGELEAQPPPASVSKDGNELPEVELASSLQLPKKFSLQVPKPDSAEITSNTTPPRRLDSAIRSPVSAMRASPSILTSMPIKIKEPASHPTLSVQIITPSEDEPPDRAAALKAVEDKGFIPLSPRIEISMAEQMLKNVRRSTGDAVHFKNFSSVVHVAKDLVEISKQTENTDAEPIEVKMINTLTSFKRWKSTVKKKKATEIERHIKDASDRFACEVPHAIQLDLISHAIPIVTKMVELYRQQLGERNQITINAVKHLERLNLVATRTATAVLQEQHETQKQTVKKTSNQGDKTVTIQLRKADLAPTPRPLGIIHTGSTHSIAPKGSIVSSDAINKLNLIDTSPIDSAKSEGASPSVLDPLLTQGSPS